MQAILAVMNEKATIWQTRIDGWKNSGTSQREYCETNGLSLATFQWWRKRLRQSSVSAPETDFVEVAVRGQPVDAGQGAITLDLGRYRIHVAPGLNDADLSRLLDLVEQR